VAAPRKVPDLIDDDIEKFPSGLRRQKVKRVIARWDEASGNF
jgi:hypothetical protein